MGRSKRDLEDLYDDEGGIPTKRKSLASLHWEESKRDRTTELEEMIMELQQEVAKLEELFMNNFNPALYNYEGEEYEIWAEIYNRRTLEES